MGPELEIVLIAVVTAVAAALPGAFLVLRRMALVSDAITHAILPGIVAAFFITGDLASPLLLVAAAATGLFTVWLIETFTRSGLVAEDAAIGLVFPALFSVGVIMIARRAGDVHLDTDVVLLGELAFAPFDRLVIGNLDLGPVSLWTMGGLLTLDLILLLAFYKELKLATVDAGLAALLGFSPTVVHYGLMGVVSVTAVGAFDAVGSILVVALMIAPPATARLLTDRLATMLWLSAGVAAVAAVSGYGVARLFDVSIAGSMATCAGVLFVAAFVLAPGNGLAVQVRRRRSQRLEFAARLLAVHLLHHEGRPEAAEENRVRALHRHLQWSVPFTRQVVRFAAGRGLVRPAGELLEVTARGREVAEDALVTMPPAAGAEPHEVSRAG
jgi:manganese/zinc/iron transport system permease protein